jgi:predicted ATPase
MKNKKSDKKMIVVSGGPGTGKSTILEILSQENYSIIPEADRMIIEKESLKKSDCLPWKNIPKFQKKVSKLQLKLEKKS